MDRPQIYKKFLTIQSKKNQCLVDFCIEMKCLLEKAIMDEILSWRQS